MDVRKATDLLCRNYASLSIARTISRTARMSSSSSSSSSSPLQSRIARPSQRHISTQPPRSGTAEARNEETASYNDDIYKRRNSDFLPPPKPRVSTQQQAKIRIISRSPDADKSRSSIDDFIEDASAPTSTLTTPRPFGAPQCRSQYSSYLMDFPSPTSSSSVSSAPISRPRIVEELPLHVRPRTGRSISVDPNRPNDLGAKLRTLEVLCARNRIKQDFNRQKFHERPGLKRKRLATERWRRDFRQRFRTVVGRVSDLRVQGW